MGEFMNFSKADHHNAIWLARVPGTLDELSFLSLVRLLIVIRTGEIIAVKSQTGNNRYCLNTLCIMMIIGHGRCHSWSANKARKIIGLFHIASIENVTETAFVAS
jgi:hypothetical protein